MANLRLQLIDAMSHYNQVVAFAVLGIFLGALVMQSLLPTVSLAPNVENHPLYGVEVAAPSKITIPAVGIETTFVGSLGLNEDRTVEVPDTYDEVGWYKYGPKPGELGPAVVLGHVDSLDGPAVFFDLKKVQVGDEVFVEREDGSVAKFVVTDTENRSQLAFPTEAVYGDVDHAGLRLITCSGTYDHNRLVYSHNLIVYAKLVE